MSIRVIFNEVLVRLGIRDILPVDTIRKVKIEECGEEMVAISEEIFVFDDTLSSPAYLRKSVYDMLLAASDDFAKQGKKILINSPYRGFDAQWRSWYRRLRQTREENPEASEEELKRLNMMRVAYPDESAPGGHQTGGAIDLTIVDAQTGEQIDMGCGLCVHGAKTRTHCDGLTSEQKANRKLLCDIMERHGFVNYPAEWWHFCYGDNMWAAYTGRKKCIYGDGADYVPEKQS